MTLVFDLKATEVKAWGKGLEQAFISRQNSFNVDCNLAVNNVLYVGVYGPEIPCDEVVIKHQGEKRYSVSYIVHQKGEYIIFVKWGDDHSRITISCCGLIQKLHFFAAF